MPLRHSEATKAEVWRLAMLHWSDAEIGRALGLTAAQVAGIVARQWQRITEKG